MKLLNDLKNMSSGVFCNKKVNVKFISRAERQKKNRDKFNRETDLAISSTGVHHRKALLDKWGC